MLISDWSSDVFSSDLDLDQDIDQDIGQDPYLDLGRKHLCFLLRIISAPLLGRARLRTSRSTLPPSRGSPRLNLCRCKEDQGRCHPCRSHEGWKARWLQEVTGCQELSPLVSLIALRARSEEHTSELQSLMRSSYAVFGLNKKR